LRAYRVVIWRVEEIAAVWTASEQSAISNYLAGGGAMFVASMELLSRLQEVSATNFINNVLHVQSFVADPDSSGALEIIGSPVDAISQDLDIVMDYTIYEDLWGGLIGPDISDTLIPGLNATTILFNDFEDSVGIRWPGSARRLPAGWCCSLSRWMPFP
jgi:hypothetical protein